MISCIKYYQLLFIAGLLSSCNSNLKPNLEVEKTAIMKIHVEQQKAHMEKNAELLLSQNDGTFYEVNRGKIKSPSRQESINKFTAYFESVDFIKWDDVTPPIFSFSNDATMATTIVNKIVITRHKADSKIDTTFFAWLSVYKKENGVWRMESIASTQ
jgi:hypothetical protein